MAKVLSMHFHQILPGNLPMIVPLPYNVNTRLMYCIVKISMYIDYRELRTFLACNNYYISGTSLSYFSYN